MARSSKSTSNGKSNGVALTAGAISRRWANKPTKTSDDMKSIMSDLTSDLLGDRIETRRATAVIGAQKHLLNTVLAEFKYGFPTVKGQAARPRILSLKA